MPLNKLALDILSKYPEKSLMGLLVDGEFLEKNPYSWLDYDNREPGSIYSGFQAFEFVINTMESKIVDCSYIRALHSKFTSFYLTNQTLDKYVQPGKFIDGGIYFGLNSSTVTVSGIQELLLSIKSGKLGDWDAQLYCLSNGTIYSRTTLSNRSVGTELSEQVYNEIASNQVAYVYYVPKKSKGFAEKNVIALLEEFHLDMVALEDEDQKLARIVQLIYLLEHLHPFEDANCRTFILGLSMRLLIEYGFIPGTFVNPNRFDGYSQKELVTELKQAMSLTRKVVEQKCYDFFPNNNDELRLLYQSYVSPIVNAISLINNPLKEKSLLNEKISFFKEQVPEHIQEVNFEEDKENTNCNSPNPILLPDGENFIDLEHTQHKNFSEHFKFLDNSHNILDF